MFHGEVNHLLVEGGRDDTGDEIRFALGERLRRAAVELVLGKPQLSPGLVEHLAVGDDRSDPAFT